MHQVWRRLVTWSRFQKLKISKKWTILNRYISETTYIHEKKVCVFEHTVLLTTYFMIIFIYFALDKFFLFFFQSLSPFKPQTAHGSYYELLWYSKVLVTAWNWGCHDGGPPKRALQNLNFFIFKARPMKFLR